MPYMNGLRQWSTVVLPRGREPETYPRCGCGGHFVHPEGMVILWRGANWQITCAFDLAAAETRLRAVA